MNKKQIVYRVIAIIIGFLAGIIIISLIESFAANLFATTENYIAPNENDDFNIAFKHLSIPLLVFVLIAYTIGSFLGGFIASIIGKGIINALASGLLLMAGGIINLLIIQHPLWFVISSLIIYLPMAYIGGKLGMYLLSKRNLKFEEQ
ncbi:MAG: hypothetical protein Q8J88_09400 [Bacteroidales bacterium]|nr:hypothetical protein [Bacteroidales bacterium]